jgi:hypothetical protein
MWRGLRGELSEGRDDVDFDARIPGKPRDLHRRPRRGRCCEVRRVGLVHRREIVHVREEYRGPDDVVEGCATGLEDLADVLKDAVRLRRDISVDDLTGRRIDWNLSGHEKQGAGPDRLGVGPDGFRRRRGRHGLPHVRRP